jgi:hypothetical protein
MTSRTLLYKCHFTCKIQPLPRVQGGIPHFAQMPLSHLKRETLDFATKTNLGKDNACQLIDYQRVVDCKGRSCNASWCRRPITCPHSFMPVVLSRFNRRRLTLLGRAAALISGELFANAIVWTAAGLAFRQADGILGLALLAWVRDSSPLPYQTRSRYVDADPTDDRPATRCFAQSLSV